MDYRLIEGHPRYIIFKTGKVFSKITKRFIKPWKDKDGYLIVKFTKKNYRVHRLVALAFIDNPDDKPMVDHIDRDKSNNNLINLRWATCSENLINTGCRKNNKLKEKNISEKINHYNNDYYVLEFRRNGNRIVKYFNKEKYSLEDVVAYRDKYLLTDL